MRVEQRGGGLRQCAGETRPYTERTLSVTTMPARFTPSACPPLWRCAASSALRRKPHGRSWQGAEHAPLFHGERLGLGAGWCNTPSPVLRGVGCRTVAWQRYCGTAGKPGGKQI